MLNSPASTIAPPPTSKSVRLLRLAAGDAGWGVARCVPSSRAEPVVAAAKTWGVFVAAMVAVSSMVSWGAGLVAVAVGSGGRGVTAGRGRAGAAVGMAVAGAAFEPGSEVGVAIVAGGSGVAVPAPTGVSDAVGLAVAVAGGTGVLVYWRVAVGGSVAAGWVVLVAVAVLVTVLVAVAVAVDEPVVAVAVGVEVAAAALQLSPAATGPS